MNDLEQELRSLVPAPLPADLATRMARPPASTAATPRRHRITGWIAGPMLAAAAAVILAVNLPQPGGPASPPTAPPPVTLQHRESVLLDERTLAVVRHGGRTWEVAEQQWHDDNLALCRAPALRLHMAATRREVVCQPVDFD